MFETRMHLRIYLIRRFIFYNIIFTNKMDKQELSQMILGDDLNKIPKWFELFKDPVWIPQYNVDWKTQRDLPMNRLMKVMQSKLVSVKDFFKNPKNIFLAHEMISQLDSSTATKFTV